MTFSVAVGVGLLALAACLVVVGMRVFNGSRAAYWRRHEAAADALVELSALVIAAVAALGCVSLLMPVLAV